MRFDRESWRKLYVTESMQHRALSLFARGLRDYLIRFAETDGTLLHDTENVAADLARVLGATGSERRALAAAVDQLIAIGYLTFSNKHLWITKFQEAQESRSPGAKRQAAYIARRKSDSADDVTSDAKPNVTGDVTPDETRHDETRRDESAAPSVADDRETMCPLNLLERAAAAGVVAELADAYRLREATVAKAVEEFVSYWTIAGGSGKRRRNWMARLRQRLHELNQQGKLIDEPTADDDGRERVIAEREAHARRELEAHRARIAAEVAAVAAKEKGLS